MEYGKACFRSSSTYSLITYYHPCLFSTEEKNRANSYLCAGSFPLFTFYPAVAFITVFQSKDSRSVLNVSRFSVWHQTNSNAGNSLQFIVFPIQTFIHSAKAIMYQGWCITVLYLLKKPLSLNRIVKKNNPKSPHQCFIPGELTVSRANDALEEFFCSKTSLIPAHAYNYLYMAPHKDRKFVRGESSSEYRFQSETSVPKYIFNTGVIIRREYSSFLPVSSCPCSVPLVFSPVFWLICSTDSHSLPFIQQGMIYSNLPLRSQLA